FYKSHKAVIRMLETAAIVAAVVGLIVCTYAYAKRALSKSPPGPVGIPGFGLLPLVMWRTATNKRHRFYLLMQEIQRKYGDLASFPLGTQELVLVSGYETMREMFAMNTDKFNGRPTTNFHKFMFKDAGIIGSEGALWQEHRRFALRVLKDFGFGRNASELQIQEEAGQLVKFLSSKDGQLVDTRDFIGKAVANVVSRFIFSNFSSYEDSNFNEFLKNLGGVTNQNVVGLITAFYRFMPVETALALSPTNRKQFDAITWIEDLSQQKVEEIRSTYNVDNEPSNYVEAYLQEQHRRGVDLGTFTDFQLVKTIWELYIAGVDTTSNTLCWSLIYAALNPELQDRCHAEIMAKIGKRQASLKDKKELHYCQAFLDECQRISTLVPMSVDHRAIGDTEFRGYKISSGSIIFVNLYGLHHDERYFPKPDMFDPDRFLTPDGQYKPSEYLNQFGVGKRSCLGEVLARMEVFLFFVTFMQHFRFEADSWTAEQREQILLGTEGGIHGTIEHRLKVTSRDN
ncbi:hypothetical protein BOX15_Mlig034102g1, partial [Macrostomum lignano]